MRRRASSFVRLFLAVLHGWLAVTGAPLGAQYPQRPAAPGFPALAPLLYVRFPGPDGMRVTFYRGGGRPETLVAPFTVGLRPGYVYRLQVANLPADPSLVLAPTLEVRGSVPMPVKMARDNPATLPLTADDFAAVRAGALVTRVITVEPPGDAYPEATRPDRPLEFSAPPGQEALEEARRHGRTLLVMRVGQRQLSLAELTSQGVPGTVLLPNERFLPPPRDLPWVPWTCAPVSDPRLGPIPPTSEICFHDGGDVGPRAGFDRQGRLTGLDPSDTVAEYADSQGRRRLAISNRVCLCVPRFVVTRGESVPVSNFARIAPGQTTAPLAPTLFRGRFITLEQDQREQPVLVASRQRPGGILNTFEAAVLGKVEGVRIVSQAVETGAVTGTCPKPEVAVPEKPLKLIKWPDRCDVRVGDVVTFFLKYTNHGGRPITDVAVSDSLTTRLEYVPGSARSDRNANFTTQANEAGSLILRWEINGTLPPGQSGVVSFQTRVR